MPITATGLRIASWNGDSIIPKILELKQLTQEYNIDIILVQETDLKPTVMSVKIPNYDFYRNGRISLDGGIAIYV